ncbi:MAG TPA: hypothetical protein VNN20_02985 [Thermodesulfobacteriota bacterium]|nr:hypothetical protein [Thermodesulfobacteriota bacterium]
MHKLSISSHKLTFNLSLGLILGILLLSGCASRQLVPLPDGGSIDPQFRSSTKSDRGVTIRVQASAWSGRPSDLSSYVTPFYLLVRNDTDKTLFFDYTDITIIDENRVQYNSLPPETVVGIIRADFRPGLFFRPFFSFGLGYGGFYRPYGFGFNTFFYDPFYPGWYYPPAYYSARYDDIFTQAFTPGLLQPNAKFEGFIYFKRIPTQVRYLTVEIGYEVEGEPRRLSFPFAVESRSR